MLLDTGHPLRCPRPEGPSPAKRVEYGGRPRDLSDVGD